LAVAERDVDPDVAILPARLDEKDAMAPRRGQAVRQHAAGAAGANDDVVERVRIFLHGDPRPWRCAPVARDLDDRPPRCASQARAEAGWTAVSRAEGNRPPERTVIES